MQFFQIGIFYQMEFGDSEYSYRLGQRDSKYSYQKAYRDSEYMQLVDGTKGIQLPDRT
jgi:hypothetical protein